MDKTRIEIKMTTLIDLTGDHFGRWVVLYKVCSSEKGKTRWMCRCECGTKRIVNGNNLRRGLTNSCGCLNREKSSERTGKLSYKHGHSSRTEKSSEYRSWSSMRNRCKYPCVKGYEYYGGCGIKVCKRWLSSFSNFWDDMGPKPTPQHTIDRYPNPNGNYEPKNCRWATKKQQRHNRRPC